MITRCNRCAMDTVGDPYITFESDGTCNYCNYAFSRKNKTYFPNEIGQRRLEKYYQTKFPLFKMS